MTDAAYGHLDPRRIYYIRVPKTASVTMSKVFFAMAKRHSFRHKKSTSYSDKVGRKCLNGRLFGDIF